ncbi:helix-turn-helix domain-containing protein [uncultured Anaerococcus sp.]|uniref:helix-turn-helix domain-containing protein n=1 Tax=uncultured Anaerococcus sp. TaxID=293428 RepID=UPI00262AB32A|nr:helix-turn-helix domain-containing protein [uncultured Anaerococcus sp.]
MDYTKQTFAIFLKNCRKNMKLSQAELSELSYVNIRTISDLENAKANIDLDKLETLSLVLNVDLVEEYFNILLGDSNSINQIVNSLNSRDRFHGSNQSIEIQALEDIKNRTNRQLIKKKIDKLILFFKSIEVKDNMLLKRKLILDALNINGKFDLDNLENNYYSDIDYRILMNYALTLDNWLDKLIIYRFIEQSNPKDKNLKPILFHNMCNAHYVLKEYDEALAYINKALDLNVDNPTSAVMLYTKAIILYDLSKPYKEYARKALEISKEADKELYSYILKNLKIKFYPNS